ncbi:hypothetical protein GHT06_013049 [Daphnia sinensis]|uniref:tRNA-dihydrouridine(20) synthase [NAD(P)+]-like n=1 Tax=Daphnia sinensis TaxID=1820382 RepID=A0AAD5KWP0_9CRUS|nr:hypothetical protein GHT06_013049 [Daphnia sinensis]
MSRLSYVDKIILAPMVRMGTLPLRLLALRYGADIVYTEEIVDKKMVRTKRVVNDILGTIDFIDEFDGSVVFRTCNEESNYVVFQVGTSDPELAVQVAKTVEKDVAGFDVNMGCPKEFSIKGGMGAALLKQPDKVKDILTNLVSNVAIPVTCKIRLLPNIEETMDLARTIQNCGVAAIAVHGRTKEERPQHPNNNEAIKRIAEDLSIPVIANGGSKEIDSYEHVLKFRMATGASSVMIARAAQYNSSVFRKEGKLPLDEVIPEYLRLCIEYDNVFTNTKYCVQMMLRDLQETPMGKRLLESKTEEEIYKIWGLLDYYKKKQEEFKNLSLKLQVTLPSMGHLEPAHKRAKTESTFFSRVCENDDIIKVMIPLRKPYQKHILPKTVLHEHACKAQHSKLPIYRSEQVDKLFFSTVVVEGKEYANRYLEKNKRSSEQAAALACLHALNLLPADVME